MKFIKFYLILALFIIFSCSKPKEKYLLDGCYYAEVVNIIGNTDYLRIGGDILINLNIKINNETTTKGKLKINKPLFSEGYVPFKKNDIVIIKVFGDIKSDNISEIFLYNKNSTNWESIYTLDDICKSVYSKKITHNQAVYSKGKLYLSMN